MLDARDDWDVINRVPLRPLQRDWGCTIFAVASTDFFDDSIWNQDLRSEALDQVEPVDAGKQDDW